MEIDKKYLWKYTVLDTHVNVLSSVDFSVRSRYIVIESSVRTLYYM